METKICKQCGEQKPTTMFRPYYGGRKGTYKTCKACEKINSREKYLARKEDLTPIESLEFDKIHMLWDVQRAAGLQPPRTAKASTSLVDDIDVMMSKYTVNEPLDKASGTSDTINAAPPELAKWLTCELTKEPEYYQDDVYEELRDRYRPVIKIDGNMNRVYDDTYKAVLDQILARFDEYEDAYYSK